MTYRQIVFLRIMSIVTFLLFLFGLASFVHSIVFVITTGMYEAIFELVCLGVHIVVTVFAFLIILKSLKQDELSIMNNLMFNGSNVNKTAFVISIILGIIGIGGFIYFLLMFFNVIPLIFGFNQVLLLTLVNTGLFIGIYSLFFLLFTKFYSK